MTELIAASVFVSIFTLKFNIQFIVELGVSLSLAKEANTFSAVYP